jgi:hypothetical protein
MLVVILLVLIAAALQATPLSASTSCSLRDSGGNSESLNHPEHCLVSFDNLFYTTADATGSWSLAGGGFVGELNALSETFSAFDDTAGQSAGRSDLNLALTTVGPVRPGLATLRWVVGSIGGPGQGGDATASVEVVGQGFVLTLRCVNRNCQSKFNGVDIDDGPELIDIPFTLGSPFTVTMSAEASGALTKTVKSAFGLAGASLEIAIRGQDDIAVPIVVPEPASLLLSACGLALLVGRRLL